MFFDFVHRWAKTGVDLTRMECKYIRKLSEKLRRFGVDLTRMECKLNKFF